MKSSFVVMIMLISIAGCTSTPNQQDIWATSQPVLSPTETDIVLPTETHIATDIITPTVTSIPRQPISTPSEIEKDKIGLAMLRSNNGCNLPCWWGIMPNQTTWIDANRFLKPFSDIYEREPSAKWLVYEVYSPLEKEFSATERLRVVYATQQGVIKEIDVSGFNEDTYGLSSILSKYGVPAEVLIGAYSPDTASPDKQVPFSVDLHYPELGINVLYGSDAFVKGETITGCLRDPHLFLWSPQEYDRSIAYILGWDQIKFPYLSLEVATGLSTQAFYDKYANPFTPPCLDTLKNLWPTQ